MSKYEEVMDIIKRYVRLEDELVELVYHVCLSAWTDNPLNLFLVGPSSIGKTWIVTNVVKLFPDANVWLLGGLSPKALVHMKAEPYDSSGRRIEPPPPSLRRRDKELFQELMDDYRERLENAKWIIDLWRKIIVFLEAPEKETFQLLRPILSHDTEEIGFKFTDKTGRGKLRTMHVIIRGYPAMICCSSDVPWMEDLVTRSLTVSPRETVEKFKAAHEVTALPFLDPYERLRRKREVERAKEITSGFASKTSAVVPFAGLLAKHFYVEQRRNMRDFKYFISLLETRALVNSHMELWLPIIGKRYVSTLEDLKAVERIWSYIYETTEFGLSSTAFHILNVIRELEKNSVEPTVSAIRKTYKMVVGTRIADSTARKYLRDLVEVGFVEKGTHPEDKRKAVYYLVEENSGNRTFSLYTKISEEFSWERARSWLEKIVTSSGGFTEKPHFTLYVSYVDGYDKYEFPPVTNELVDVFYQNIVCDNNNSEAGGVVEAPKEPGKSWYIGKMRDFQASTRVMEDGGANVER